MRNGMVLFNKFLLSDKVLNTFKSPLFWFIVLGPMVRLFLDQNLNLTTTYCVGAPIGTQDESGKQLSVLSQDSILQHRPQDVV
jgi:hypothetical protein